MDEEEDKVEHYTNTNGNVVDTDEDGDLMKQQIAKNKVECWKIVWVNSNRPQ